MPKNVTQKLIEAHRVDGEMTPGKEIALQNLANFGILPLIFEQPADWDQIEVGNELAVADVRRALAAGDGIEVRNKGKGQTYRTRAPLTRRQTAMILEGSLINLMRKKGHE